MTTPKIEKVKVEIEKAKARIAESQARLRTLERQKTELENERIVALVRSERVGDADLADLMRSFKDGRAAKAPALEDTELGEARDAEAE